MISINDIERLSKLARIQITDEESGELIKDLDSVLSYVSQLKEVEDKVNDKNIREGDLWNVMRDDDADCDELGKLSDKLVDITPEQEGGYVKVKRVM